MNWLTNLLLQAAKELKDLKTNNCQQKDYGIIKPILIWIYQSIKTINGIQAEMIMMKVVKGSKRHCKTT